MCWCLLFRCPWFFVVGRRGAGVQAGRICWRSRVPSVEPLLPMLCSARVSASWAEGSSLELRLYCSLAVFQSFFLCSGKKKDSVIESAVIERAFLPASSNLVAFGACRASLHPRLISFSF